MLMRVYISHTNIIFLYLIHACKYTYLLKKDPNFYFTHGWIRSLHAANTATRWNAIRMCLRQYRAMRWDGMNPKLWCMRTTWIDFVRLYCTYSSHQRAFNHHRIAVHIYALIWNTSHNFRYFISLFSFWSLLFHSFHFPFFFFFFADSFETYIFSLIWGKVDEFSAHRHTHKITISNNNVCMWYTRCK